MQDEKHYYAHMLTQQINQFSCIIESWFGLMHVYSCVQINQFSCTIESWFGLMHVYSCVYIFIMIIIHWYGNLFQYDYNYNPTPVLTTMHHIIYSYNIETVQNIFYISQPINSQLATTSQYKGQGTQFHWDTLCKNIACSVSWHSIKLLSYLKCFLLSQG